MAAVLLLLALFLAGGTALLQTPRVLRSAEAAAPG
eukprot:SAG31_NODE_42191_length_272_cov_1.473988_1_plen_34_part_10